MKDLQNLFSVEGKVVVVTGGSRGIGEMIAAGFLANGAKVYISSRKADACDAAAERLQKEIGGECTLYQLICLNWTGSKTSVPSLSRVKTNWTCLLITPV